MSAKYTRQFTIPPSTSSVLTDLTRELLRQSTYSNDLADLNDLHAFSYQHFCDRLEGRAREQEEEGGGGRMNNGDLIER